MVEDGEQLTLDLGGELNQLTASIQILVTGNHLRRWKMISNNGHTKFVFYCVPNQKLNTPVCLSLFYSTVFVYITI